jgi:circadian clock protein KaiC
MMGGGIPEGDSALIAGPSGTGKSLLATEFIMAGLRAGEAGIITVFEERPEEYVDRAMAFGLDLRAALNEKRLEIIYMRPLDLSVDEMMQELIEAVQRTKASRLVIDSIAGFELALAPGFRAEFRESLYRMILALTGVGITILSTLETQESFDKFLLSSHMVSFLTDDIIRMRYAEIGSQIRKLIMVIKMRGGAHSNDIREYEIKSDGIAIDGQLKDYVRLLTGIPERVSSESSHKPGTQPSDVTVTDGGRAKE